MKCCGIGFLTALVIATALSGSPAEARERINIIYPSISGLVLGLWVTKDAGMFDKHGLDVNLIYIQSASAVMQAMLGERPRSFWLAAVL
jgi:ABC-type nitrate/sulfonate/bicarbonate transport system substrate-binding protein